MKVLAIVYCYPPLLVPAAMCYMKLLMGLQRSGADVEIVHIDPATFQSPDGTVRLDPELAALSPDDIRTHCIRSPETTPWIRWIKRLDPDRRLSHPWLEPKKREWTVPALRHLRRLALSDYDVLLTCSQPHANHLIGLELQRAIGIPWVAYFSDPWTDSPYIQYGSHRVREHNRRLEDRILARADRVLYTCEEMLQLVREHHPALDERRSGVLPHAFVSEWYERKAFDEDLPSPGHLRLVQTGSFYGPRSPQPLIDSLRRIRDRRGGDLPLRVDFFGGMSRDHRQAIADAGLEEHLPLHGMVPYLDTLTQMKQSDGLLLVDAPLTSTADSVFLPSKLIDYLGSGTPIMAITPEHGATARVLRETGGVVCAIERPEEIDRVLEETLSRGRVPGEMHAGAVAEYDYRNVGRRLHRVFEELLAER